jgi:hypothetical protein
MVRVLGDITGLGKSFDATAAKGKLSADTIHSSMGTMLDRLNSAGVLGEFGDTLSQTNDALGNMAGNTEKVADKMLGLGGVALAAGAALTAMGSKDQAAHQQLQAAIAATGHSYDQYGDKIEEAIKHEAHFGNSAADTQDALRALTTATNSPAKALDLLNTATNLAASRHESLTSAATQLAKVYDGNTKLLKQYGIAVTATATPQKELTTATAAHTKAVQAQMAASRSLLELQTADAASKTVSATQTLKLQDAQNKLSAANLVAYTTNEQVTKAQNDVKNGTNANAKAIAELGAKLAGQASAQADTFSGRMKALRTEIDNGAASFGQKYGPDLTKAGAALSGLGGVIKAVQAVQTLFTTTTETATAATDAATVSNDALDASLLANPIVLIVAGIAVLIAAIVAIGLKFGWWKDVINDTWAFIKIAFADVKGIFMDVWNWVAANWPLLLAILTGPIGLAVYLIVSNFGKIKDGIQDVIDWMGVHASEVFSPLWDAAKFVWNAIANGWNDTIGSLNFSVPSWVPFVGGKTFGFPKIPTLEQGGYVAATGLALVHEGENVIPKGGLGPAVHIEHLHLANTLDVDAFMARVAFHTRLAQL